MKNNIDYQKIDLGIRQLVYILNEEVPFTTTGPMNLGGSCQGHLIERIGGGIIPDHTVCFPE